MKNKSPITVAFLADNECEAAPTKRAKPCSTCCSCCGAAFEKHACPCVTLFECLFHDTVPKSVEGQAISNRIDRFHLLLKAHGIHRTSIVTAPQPAISIFVHEMDSNGNSTTSSAKGRAFLVTMLGCHEKQLKLELYYKEYVRNVYNLLCLCRFCLSNNQNNKNATLLAQQTIQDCLNQLDSSPSIETAKVNVPQRLDALMHTIRQQKNTACLLQKQFERIQQQNVTLSNALMHLFCIAHDCQISSVLLRPSAELRFTRMTVTFQETRTSRGAIVFDWMPCLPLILQHSVDVVAMKMVQSFWEHLLRLGYYATPKIKHALEEHLHSYFSSGLLYQQTSNVIPLHAHFTPTYPLSVYLYGNSGTGKSSLVQLFPRALQATLADYCDGSSLTCRFVKQTLNQPLDRLQLAFQTRPNNNDLSLSQVIASRRMSLMQTKPGIVVLGLEEMPSCTNVDPNQHDVVHLLQRHMSNKYLDASTVTIITSNYELEQLSNLNSVHLFRNLVLVKSTAMSHDDRQVFATAYLSKCIKERVSSHVEFALNVLKLSTETEDVRTLIKFLRMISFYCCELLSASSSFQADRFGLRPTRIQVAQRSNRRVTIDCCGNVRAAVELEVRESGVVLPVLGNGADFDPRVLSACDALHQINEENEALFDAAVLDELKTVLQYWIATAVAPAVVVSKDPRTLHMILQATMTLDHVATKKCVDVDNCKIMKSLYDDVDAYNLRDELLEMRRNHPSVVVELLCHSLDAQLLVREIIEDTPSMTSFSTERSALRKEGFLFLVYAEQDISPEIISRATLVI